MANVINRNDKIIACIFGVKDSNYVSKQQLMDSIVKLSTELEQFAFELFAVDPTHKRFNNLPEAEYQHMQNRVINLNCKRSVWYHVSTNYLKLKRLIVKK